jgi:Ser/Thr protein kinase RdoA (MazF antagonist)
MGDSWIPEYLLREAELAIAAGSIPAREARAWLADWQGIRGVLRCRPVPGSAAARARLLDDVAWLHAFLARLAGVGFPSPQPLAAFGGRSWTTAEGLVWELVSYLPGREVGWDSQPPIGQIGILLARYHAAAGRVPVARQRPSVTPLADVPAILLSGRLAAACPDPERAAVIRRLAARLAADLDDLGHPATGRLVIHGDFTSHNVIADGTPPRTVGVIDFQRAHLEVPLADIGYGLWRSGRPHQDADHLDVARLRWFVRGYASTIPIPPDAAGALPVFLYGRGLQMIAKRAQAGQAGTGIVPQVQWIAGNATAISDAIADALP